MPEPLLTPNDSIAEGFKNGEFLLSDTLGTTRLTLNEHPGGHLTLYIGQRLVDADGLGEVRYDGVSLLSNATNELRRLLNRAHRERTRRAP